MVKETAGEGQEFLLLLLFSLNIPGIFYIRTAILLSSVTLNFNILVQLWVAGEGPTIEWSYSPHKIIVCEKRLSFRGHGDCILLY